jgi:[ribosomal protein S18]-alanine N-acetyltransferase
VSAIEVRPALKIDFAAIARIQQCAPEAAQWPVSYETEASIFVATVNGEPAGFCVWSKVAPDEAEILNLAVEPARRRRGVGGALLAAVSRAARATLFLEVAESNAGAIAFYRSAGFEPLGIRKGYYAQGNINAVVMKKSSC